MKLWGASRYLPQLFRRSLQLRAVAFTVLLSGASLVLLGGFLSFSIGNGLFQTRLGQVLAESESASVDVQNTFSAATVADEVALQTLMNAVVPKLESTNQAQSRQVALLRTVGQTAGSFSLQSPISAELDINLITPQFRQKLAQADGRQVYQSISIPVADATHPGLLVGSQIDIPIAGKYELYLLYDLQGEQDTLDFVQRTLVGGGAILILLIGMVSYLVTDWLVKPVQVVADISERIAAGQLDERVQVRGDDVIASLARSFNKMADSQQSQIDQITRVSKMQQAFVSNVSHELRTPLTAIKSSSDLIVEKQDLMPAMLQRPAQLLQTQVRRFGKLLEDLLEISRFDAGAVNTEIELQDIQGVIGMAIAHVETLAADRGSKILIDLPSYQVEVEHDARRIERVLRNLLSNAVEHGEGRPIEVALAADEHAAAISVTDHGIGMTTEQLDRVFDRFWRADPARPRTIGGTGLGLSIAMEDTKVHGGWLQVWAAPGVGTSFRLTLPLRQGEQFTQSPLPLPPKSLQAEGGEQS